ncbi:repair protein PSO2 SNM1 [Kickxella alabastrina]|uniref:Repair protein PSO2 SNM1 n=1 Tax=Kickxella alabastrina TaxID=61397 RepID=A0ACC1IVT8_9FUNG|nr:repair protein PSO2 SNM1 [Kickxella alabastrina]
MSSQNDAHACSTKRKIEAADPPVTAPIESKSSKSPRRADNAETGETVVCPLCQVTLSHLSVEKAELHVNGCLDVVVLEEKKANRSRRSITAALLSPKLASAKEQQAAHPFKAEMLAATTEQISQVLDHLVNGSSIEAMFREIELVAFKPESPPQGAYTYVYELPSDSVTWQPAMSPRSTNPKRQPKPLPSYKRMPGTTFTVDAFKYGILDFCTAYFLTHFHSDLYGGLTKGFTGDIYCSRITANCITAKYGTDQSRIHAMPMNTRCIVQGVYVTLIDAEHCPGAAIILFEIPGGPGSQPTRIVHTGDFRASRSHVDQILSVFGTDLTVPVTPELLDSATDIFKSHLPDMHELPIIDYIYLDTTYLEPTYSFPKQSQVIETVGRFCHDIYRDPGYLPSYLNNVRNSTKQSGQLNPVDSENANTLQSPAPPLATKISLITQWFRPLQRSFVPKLDSTTIAGTNSGYKRNNILFVVGTYTIGKEKLFIEIACQIQSKIFVSKDKRKLLECIASPSVLALLTDNMYEAQVHAVSLGMINMRGMAEYLASLQPKSKFTSIVAFSPTGWSHAGPYIPGRREALSPILPKAPSAAELDLVLKTGSIEALSSLLAHSAHTGDDKQRFGLDKLKPRGSSNKVTIFPVPYSEHSSFAELARFVWSLRAEQVIPTVFSTSDKNYQANCWLHHWHELKTLSGSRICQGIDAASAAERSHCLQVARLDMLLE